MSNELDQQLPKNKEFLFKWVKQFSYLTLKTVETKVVIDEEKMNIESRTYHLGFIKGKANTTNLLLNKIKGLQQKKLITYSDMAFAAFFIIAGFVVPISFLIAALFIWTGINTSIVITTDLGSTFKIPASNKKDVEEFIKTINEIH